MMAYSSTDEATTSEDEENIEKRHRNLAARSPQTPMRVLVQAKPQKIYTEVTLNATDEAAANVDQLNIARCVYYYQKKLYDNPNISSLPQEMIIPDDLKQYKDQQFISYDNGPRLRRMIIFQHLPCSSACELQNIGE
uniref:Uncharacterized protein n=1 Tax=Ditylenchus dipsaci TaxID=166011 RepID=A0A915CSN0_9BILA